jgi:hexokinase
MSVNRHSHATFFFFTQYDTELDAQSLNAGQQILEKLIGGTYIGKRRCMYSSARGHRCSIEWLRASM